MHFREVETVRLGSNVRYAILNGEASGFKAVKPCGRLTLQKALTTL
jgi:hypothetical protein